MCAILWIYGQIAVRAGASSIIECVYTLRIVVAGLRVTRPNHTPSSAAEQRIFNALSVCISLRKSSGWVLTIVISELGESEVVGVTLYGECGGGVEGLNPALTAH